MGHKRFIISIIVVAFVVISVISLLFQLGADEQVLGSLLPRVEERLGVEITHGEVSASLTGLSIEDVVVSSPQGKGVFARIDDLALSVRVGPLFVGEVDITSVMAEGLKVSIGAGKGGASIDQWKNLLQKLGERQSGGEPEEERRRPEVHLLSGEVEFAVGEFVGYARGISGIVGDQGKATLEIDEYALAHRESKMLQGKSGEVLIRPENRLVEAALAEPELALRVDGDSLKVLSDDAQEALRTLGYEGGKAEDTDDKPEPEAGNRNDLSFRTSIRDGFFRLIRNDNGAELQVKGFTMNLTKGEGSRLSVNAGGRLPGAEAPFTVKGHLLGEGAPEFTIEIPNAPLEKTGGFLFSDDLVDFSAGYADVKLDMEVPPGRHEISLSGALAVSDLTIRHERISKEPIEKFAAHSDFKMTYDWEGKVVHLERFLVSRKLARATIRGDIHLDTESVNLFIDIPSTPCGNILSAIPVALRSRVGDLRLMGDFSMGMKLVLDTEKPDKSVVEADLDNGCRIATFDTVPEPGYFKGPFSYTAYNADGSDLKLFTGPGTDRWIPLTRISPYIIEAVLTTEDGKFWRHKGITLPEVSKAIAMNLQHEDLKHGASTITMQLAKNLFLTRERTFARKLQELFFVWYLETYFEKEEILTLYLNVIEFGPSVYGILDASEHYFGRHPEELNALESVFLIRLLPSPVIRHKNYERAEVSEKMLKSLHRVLDRMLERERIDRFEHNEAITLQTLLFHKEGDPLPEPRPPVRRPGPEGGEMLEEDGSFDDEEPDLWDGLPEEQ